MANTREIKEEILRKFHTLSVCIPNGDMTQWTIRCPYCGDSANQTHGHLSVQIDTENDEVPMLYRCFKCEASGLVTDRFLNDIGLSIDIDTVKGLRLAHRKSARFNKMQNSYVENLVIPEYSMNPDIDAKLKYISRRLGYKFTLEDAKRFKLILDLYQFMTYNHLTMNMTRGQLWFLNHNYIGFLASNNNVITQRCIIPKDQMTNKIRRYHKTIINESNKNPNSFYSIPVSVDIMSTEKLHVHIAEGTFDIISIYLNIEHNEPGKHLFFASCGFGPMAIIQYLVYCGLGYNITLHLYCDNDKSDKDEIFMLNRHKGMLEWLDEIYFHRNQYPNEKDYGVSKANIVDGKRRIK